MPEVNLSLDLASLFVEPPEFDADPVALRTAMRDAVVAKAAATLVASFSPEDLHEMRHDVQATRSRMVRDALVVEVTAALEMPIQRTTQWGETVGDAVTVRELVRKELEEFLNGRTPAAHRDALSSERTPRNLAELVAAVARDTMNSSLSKSVRDAKAKVDQRVQEILTEAISAKLAGKK